MILICPKFEISLIAFCLLKLCQKRSFFDIYERKQSFLDQKIEVLTKGQKSDIFERG